MNNLLLSKKQKKAISKAFVIMLLVSDIVKVCKKLTNKEKAINKVYKEIIEYVKQKDSQVIIMQILMQKVQMIISQHENLNFAKGGIILKPNLKK